MYRPRSIRRTPAYSRRRPMRRMMRRRARVMSRYARGSVGRSQQSRQLNIFKYPFSTTTMAAKIPDGNATLSSGQRFQVCESFSLKGAAANYIALVPGFDCMIWYLDGAPSLNSAQPGAAGSSGDAMQVEGPVTSDGSGPVAAWKAVNTPGQAFGTERDKVSKWRLVSCGMKIQLVNNSDTNEGYFEAIRISTGVVPGSDTLATTLAGFSQTTNAAQGFVDQPSYVCGKLRDIHKYLFQCKPDGNNHDFNAGKDNMDNGFDVVLLRIIGRATTGQTDNSNSQIVVHGVSNQEIVYAPQSTFARFHTECVYSKSWQARTHASWVDIKAAVKNVL